MEHSPTPVGTAHKKINPMAELPDMNTREKFWQQDQEQEKVSCYYYNLNFSLN